MQSRRLRLGDVVDDYCPRERRLSNHVIVAIVDDTIKQTRCSTCDFEHPFKHGKVPVRRARKDSTAALVQQVLDESPDAPPAAPEPRALVPPAPRGVLRNGGPGGPAADLDPAPALAAGAPGAATDPPPDDPADAGPDDRRDDDGPVHRTLIRATLPKIEGEVPTRPIPTFTAHEAAIARPNKFRRFRPNGGPRGARPFGVMTSGKPSPFTAQPQRGQGPNSGPPRSGNQQPGRKNGARRGKGR